MQINIQRTSVIPAEAGVIPDTESRSVQTRVLVANGGTVVLGGMYQNNYTESAVTGVPILRHIPIIGFLFRTPHAISESKRELLVFITPKILNVEEAGFTVQKERSIDLPGADDDLAAGGDGLDEIDDISSESLLDESPEAGTDNLGDDALMAPEEASAPGSELEELTSSSLEGEELNELESQEVEELEKLDDLEDLENL
jgi:hypothetical protein